MQLSKSYEINISKQKPDIPVKKMQNFLPQKEQVSA